MLARRWTLPCLLPAICSLYLLPDHSPITLWSLPGRIIPHFNLWFSLSYNVWCSWVDGYAARYSSLWTAESMLSNLFLSSEDENFSPPSKTAFNDPVTSSVHESSKLFLTENPSGWPCVSNPQNGLPPLRIIERPPHPPSCREYTDGGGQGRGRRGRRKHLHERRNGGGGGQRRGRRIEVGR